MTSKGTEQKPELDGAKVDCSAFTMTLPTEADRRGLPNRKWANYISKLWFLPKGSRMALQEVLSFTDQQLIDLKHQEQRRQDSPEPPSRSCLARWFLPRNPQRRAETVINIVMVLGLIGSMMPILFMRPDEDAFCKSVGTFNNESVAVMDAKSPNPIGRDMLLDQFPDATISAAFCARLCLGMEFRRGEKGHCHCRTFILSIRHCSVRCPAVQPMVSDAHQEWPVPKEILHFLGRVVLFWCDFTTEQPFRSVLGSLLSMALHVAVMMQLVVFGPCRAQGSDCSVEKRDVVNTKRPGQKDLFFPCRRCIILGHRSAFTGFLLFADAFYYAINLFNPSQAGIQTYIFYHAGLGQQSANVFYAILVGFLILKMYAVYILFCCMITGKFKCRWEGVMPDRSAKHTAEKGSGPETQSLLKLKEDV